MINQQSSSQIQNSQLLLTKGQLIQQILRIKYQQEQINNRAYRSLQIFLESPQEEGYYSKIKGPNMYWKEFCLFSKKDEFMKSYYPMKNIMKKIQNIILQRSHNDYNQPICLNFYEKKKSHPNLNYSNEKKQSIHQRKTSGETNSTCKNSKVKNIKRDNIILDDIEFQETSSMILRKIQHDLSQVLQNFCRQRLKSHSLKLNLNKNCVSNKITTKQIEFKKKLRNANISQIQPLIRPDYYDINQQNQLKDAVWDYGLKKNRKKKQNSTSIKKRFKVVSSSKQKIQNKSSNSFAFVCSSKIKLPQQKMDQKHHSQINYLSTVRNSQKFRHIPLTPTPRYMQSNQRQHSRERDNSQNCKRTNKKNNYDFHGNKQQKNNSSKSGNKNIFTLKKSREANDGQNHSHTRKKIYNSANKLLTIKSKSKI